MFGISHLHPVLLAFIAGLLTWCITGLGAATVFLTRTVNQKKLNTMLGFSAGIMLAACFWSLLAPAVQMSINGPAPKWFPACAGFLLGCGFMSCIDRILPHLHLDKPLDQAEGIKTKWDRTTLLVFAITLHNIPEGLALGVAFGAIGSSSQPESLAAALTLAVGIGLQDFPEGMAISMPLRASGFSRWKSFMIGQLSGLAEIAGAVLGAALVFLVKPILPYALSFAAGAMIFVIIEELIPESQSSDNTDTATLATVIGFTLMMFLEIALT